MKFGQDSLAGGMRVWWSQATGEPGGLPLEDVTLAAFSVEDGTQGDLSRYGDK